MAKANQVKLCPYCKTELLDPIPKECSMCGHQLVSPKNDYFGSPDYLYFQREHHLGSLIKEEYKKNQRPVTDTELKKSLKIQDELVAWVRASQPEEKFAALYDARVVISNVVCSKISGEELGKIIALGKSIGKLAEDIDKYMRDGGTTYDRVTATLPTEPRPDSWDSSATA